MAELDLGAGGADGDPRGGHFGTVLNWAGALTSLTLIAGVSAWGYQLAVRDVSGVPVIRALEGPMRVAPDDPGGEETAHQGLAVNAIAAEGTAEPPAERLVLAPPPTALTEEDATGAALRAAEFRATTVAPGLREEALALAEVIAEGVEPLSGSIAPPVMPALPDPVVMEPAETPEVIPASVPGVRISPRPPLRPDGDLAARAVAASVATSVSAALDGSGVATVDPDTITPGTRLVQLGAFDSEADALREWEVVADRFGDYLDGKGRVIQRAESGGKTFFRLRVVGFDDIGDARRFCAVLVAENAGCFPVVTR